MVALKIACPHFWRRRRIHFPYLSAIDGDRKGLMNKMDGDDQLGPASFLNEDATYSFEGAARYLNLIAKLEIFVGLGIVTVIQNALNALNLIIRDATRLALDANNVGDARRAH
jgi:hypothetical protein